MTPPRTEGPPLTHRPALQAELDRIREGVMELTKQVELAIERASGACANAIRTSAQR